MGFLAKIKGGKWDKCKGKFFDQAFLIFVKYGTFSIRVVRELYVFTQVESYFHKDIQ